MVLSMNLFNKMGQLTMTPGLGAEKNCPSHRWRDSPFLPQYRLFSLLFHKGLTSVPPLLHLLRMVLYR